MTLAVVMLQERARQQRLEDEERARVVIDQEEAELKRKSRQLQIERANKMLYDETDRVKAFHSRLLMSDILKEREEQIEYKEERKQVLKEQEKLFQARQKKALQLAEEAEEKKFLERRDRTRREREEQQKQVEVVRQNILREIAQDIEEGKELQRIAAEEVRATRHLLPQPPTPSRAHKQEVSPSFG